MMPLTICPPVIGAAFMPKKVGFHLNPMRTGYVVSLAAIVIAAVAMRAGATNSR